MCPSPSMTRIAISSRLPRPARSVLLHRAPFDHRVHAAGGAVARQLVLEDAVDLRVLVLVLDLSAALVHVNIGLLFGPDGATHVVAAAAPAQREVPCGLGAA